MTILKSRINSRDFSYFGLVPAEGVSASNGHGCYSTLLSGGVLEALGGKEDGAAIEEVKANQRAVLHLGTIKPSKYHVLIEVNPALHSTAVVGAPQVVDPGKEVSLDLVISAFRNTNPSELDWTVRLYQIS